MMQQIIPIIEIQKTLRSFKLSGIVNTLEIRLKQADEENLGYTEFLGMLLEDEAVRRADNKRTKLYKKARLPFEKGLEDFDFTFQPSIKKQEILELSTCRFIEKKENLIFIGQPGTGKTHLSIALALEALGRSKTVLFTSVWDMINTLQQSRQTTAIKEKCRYILNPIF